MNKVIILPRGFCVIIGLKTEMGKIIFWTRPPRISQPATSHGMEYSGSYSPKKLLLSSLLLVGCVPGSSYVLLPEVGKVVRECFCLIWSKKSPMFKLNSEKDETLRIILQISANCRRAAKNFRRLGYAIDYSKAFDCVDHEIPWIGLNKRIRCDLVLDCPGV